MPRQPKNHLLPTYIISAYYHSSETVYAFGPFYGDDMLNRFLAADTEPNKHEPWHVVHINTPEMYGTGQEINSDIWRWNDEQ